MVAVVLALVPVTSFQINGVPASGARLFVYSAGTTTKINTYTDEGGGTLQTNPIVMNSRGEPQNASLASVGIWIPPTANYKMVFAPPGTDDPPSSPIWTVDNLTPPSSGGVVNSIDFTATGLTPDGATTGAITVAGILKPASGGLGAASLSGLLVGNGASPATAVAAPTGTVVGASDAQTLTNKRITARVSTAATTATLTPNSDSFDCVELTALTSNLTIAAPTGTPVNFQRLTIRITDNSSSHTLTWNAIYNDIAAQLPASSGGTATPNYIGLEWNSNTSKWDVLAFI